LHGLEQARLTHAEVKQLIQTLAAWDAITTQDEANDLLALMGLKPTSFSEQEWKTSPLNRLEPSSRLAPLTVSAENCSTSCLTCYSPPELQPACPHDVAHWATVAGPGAL
jgi:hypothetical protein